MRGNNETFEFGTVVSAPGSSPQEAQPAFLVVSSLTHFQGIQLVPLGKFSSSNTYFLSETNCVLGSNLTCGIFVNN